MGKSFPPLEKEMASSNVAIPTNNVWRPQTSIKNGKHKVWSYNLERDSLNVNVDDEDDTDRMKERFMYPSKIDNDVNNDVNVVSNLQKKENNTTSTETNATSTTTAPTLTTTAVDIIEVVVLNESEDVHPKQTSSKVVSGSIARVTANTIVPDLGIRAKGGVVDATMTTEDQNFVHQGK